MGWREGVRACRKEIEDPLKRESESGKTEEMMSKRRQFPSRGHIWRTVRLNEKPPEMMGARMSTRRD